MSTLTDEEYAGLPPALQKQARELAEMDKSLAAAQEQALATEGTTVTTEAAPEGTQPQAPEGTPAPQNQPQDAALSELAKLREDLNREHNRYKVLQGKYNAETQALRQQTETLRQQVEAIQKAQPAAPSIDYTAVDADKLVAMGKQLGLSESEMEYGTDLLGLVYKVASAVSRQEAEKTVTSRVAPLEQMTQAAAADRFTQELGRLVPDWAEVNERREFLDWLDVPDPITGRRRQELLSDADSANDARRVAAIFNQFKSTQAQNPKPTQPARPKGPSLDAQVTPAGAPSGPVPSKPIYSGKEWHQAQDDLTRNPSDPARIKRAQELDAAMADGRVDWSR